MGRWPQRRSHLHWWLHRGARPAPRAKRGAHSTAVSPAAPTRPEPPAGPPAGGRVRTSSCRSATQRGRRPRIPIVGGASSGSNTCEGIRRLSPAHSSVTTGKGRGPRTIELSPEGPPEVHLMASSQNTRRAHRRRDLSVTFPALAESPGPGRGTEARRARRGLRPGGRPAPPAPRGCPGRRRPSRGARSAAR